MPPPGSTHPVGFIRQYELVDRVKAYDPDADEDLLNRAYVFAMKAHGGQTRKSGDPYFTHPLAVASILTELRADPATVATALLHDVVEDTDTSVDDIKRLFGSEIAKLVDGVTKLSQIELKSEANRQAENFRKLVVAMADDVRVLLVKLADRLHNMRTLGHVADADKRQRVALETMEIYAPLAGRVGVQRFREELEDLSFKELSPHAYETIKTRLEALQRTTVTGVVELAQTLRSRLAKAGVASDV
ncbi:MAG: HD domain-containing protein, partial [Amphiplicatus sp.]